MLSPGFGISVTRSSACSVFIPDLIRCRRSILIFLALTKIPSSPYCSWSSKTGISKSEARDAVRSISVSSLGLYLLCFGIWLSVSFDLDPFVKFPHPVDDYLDVFRIELHHVNFPIGLFSCDHCGSASSE